MMRSLTYLLALLGCIFLGVIGSPISTDVRILTKRGLEVTDGKEIVLVNSQTGSKKDVAAVSDDDKSVIAKREEKIKGRNLPYISE